jgi:orotidine-5'-phosphate decarboxylase
MFFEKLRAASARNGSFLCVGLDPDPELMPQPHVASFLRDIVEATADLVCAYKPNLSFFEALGIGGMQTLLEGLRSVPEHIPIIADAKRGDIGNTARFYAKALFGEYGFDATTVNAYGGRDAVEPFLEYTDRGVFIWCRSSNPGAADLQNLTLNDGRPLYEAVAEKAREWNEHGNVGLVMGTTWPQELERVRSLCPDMTFLMPGIGAQGGDLSSSVRAALDSRGEGLIVSASRQVLYASKGRDYAKAARRAAQELRDQINRERETVLAQR